MVIIWLKFGINTGTVIKHTNFYLNKINLARDAYF